MRGILVVDHGSRVPAANRVLEEVAEAMRAAVGQGTVIAHAHQEAASPSIAEAVDALASRGVTELVVVPFFLAPGRHAMEDVPRLAREAAARHGGLSVEVLPPPLPESTGALAAIVMAAIPRADREPR